MREFSPNTWQVEAECPQCGAPVTMEESDRILPCKFCRTRLYLSCGDFFRYYLSPGSSPAEEILFIPYRRVKGLVFLFRGREIHPKILDSNILALRHPTLPPTLGLRPQILKLRFADPSIPGRFLVPHGTSHPLEEDAPMDSLPGSVAARRLPDDYRSLLGRTESIIYAPFFVRGNTYYDAVLQRPAASATTGGIPSEPVEKPDHRWVEFLPTLCPRCGWDLHGEKETLVLLCGNCETAWEAERGGFHEVDYSMVNGTETTSVHLPFWRIRASIPEIRLETYEDLAEFANLPARARSGHPAGGVDFWIPAFKVNPLLFLRLTKVVTLHQPLPELNKTLPSTSLYPVTLPVTEGAEGVRLAAANLAVPRGPMLARLPRLQVKIHDHLLTYLPFTERGGEVIQPAMTISIQRSALRLGRLF